MIDSITKPNLALSNIELAKKPSQRLILNSVASNALNLSTSPIINYEGVIAKLYRERGATAEQDVFGEARNYSSKNTTIDQSLNRNLTISIVTDDGDTISINSKNVDRVFEKHFETKQGSSYTYEASTENFDETKVEGELDAEEMSDLDNTVMKVKEIFEIAAWVSKGQMTQEDLSNAIAEFSNGNVDQNTLASVSTSLTVSMSYDQSSNTVYEAGSSEDKPITEPDSLKATATKPSISSLNISLEIIYKNFMDNFQLDDGEMIKFSLLKDAFNRLYDEEARTSKDKFRDRKDTLEAVRGASVNFSV